jgi:hypothetical protein
MDNLSPLDQLLQQEAQSRADAAQVQGEHATTVEQDGYQSSIDQRRQQPGLLSRIVTGAADLVTHPVDDLKEAWNGVTSGANEFLIAGDALLSKVPGLERDPFTGMTHEQEAAAGRQSTQSIQFNTDKDNTGGGFVKSTAQFLWGRAALGGGGLVANVGSMATVFNPHDPAVTQWLADKAGLKSAVDNAIGSPAGDSEWEGRLWHALDGLGFEAVAAVAGGVVSWVRGARAVRSLNETAAAIEATPSTRVTPAGEPPATSGEPAADLPSTEGTPQAQPEAAHEAAPQAAPEVLHPADPALKLDVPADKAADVLKAINEGRFADVPNVLDDTHRTIPWDQLSDGPALKNLFAAVEDGIGRLIKDNAGVAPVSRETIVQLSKDIGGDVTALGRLYSGVTGEGGLAARITAGYNMLTASARQLKDLAAKVDTLRPDTPEGAQALLDFQKQLNLHGAIVGQVRQSSAEIGRALWAHKQLKSSSDVALSNLMDYANTPVGTSTLQKLAKTITNAEDLRSLTNAADQVNGKGWWNVVREIAQNGMLSSPKTQITNAAGLLAKSSLALVERYVAAGIGTGQRLLGSQDAATFREAWAHTTGMAEGIRAAWKLAAKSVQDENFVSQFSQPTTRAIERSTEGRVGADLALSQAINLVGKAIRWPGRAMGLLDHFSQAIGYQGDLSARAYVQAAAEADAKGLTAGAREEFLTSRMADLKANPTTELQEKAMDAGRYQAFLEDGQTPLAAIPQALNKVPLLKLIVAPFTHRPGNLLRQGLVDYTPLAPLSQGVRDAWAAGGSDRSVAIARGVLGTSLLLEGINIAESGNLTGARLGSRNTESLDGIPTYSVKVGERWIKYDRIDPIGLWLGGAADLHEFFSRHYDPTDEAGTSKAQQAVQGVIQTLSTVAFDKSFLKSADQLVQAFGERDPEKADALYGQFVASNVAKFVPFSGALGAVAQTIDPTQRSIKGGDFYDGVLAKLPFYSQSLPPRRDLLGRPMEVQSAWNPFSGTTGNPDQMDQELSKLALKVNPPSRSINGFTLDPHEYDDVISRATSSPIFGGLTLEQKLREETSSQQWANNAAMADGGQLRNGTRVQELINGAYDYGKQSYLKDHPGLIEQKVAKQRSAFEASRTSGSAFLRSIPDANANQ